MIFWRNSSLFRQPFWPGFLSRMYHLHLDELPRLARLSQETYHTYYLLNFYLFNHQEGLILTSISPKTLLNQSCLRVQIIRPVWSRWQKLRKFPFISSTHKADAFSQFQLHSDQANKAMNAVSGAIPDEAKSYMRQAKEKILDSDKLRSFSDFFGFREQGAFNVALNPAVLCPRIKDNIVFFYLNYILLAAVIFLITLLATMINPQTIVMFICLAAAWFVVMRATAEDKKFGPITITRKNATFLMMIITGIVAFFVVKDIFFITLGSGSAFSLIHAIFRNGTKEKIDALSSSTVPNETEMPHV